MQASEAIVDTAVFEKAREMLGTSFIRILGYFLEDAPKAVAEIEAAFHEGSAARMVRPAHTLKGESRQLGAMQLGELAYELEMGARRCVERQDEPSDLLVHVAKLRPLWNETHAILERETNPLCERPAKFGGSGNGGGFGRAGVHTQRFGRL